MLHRMTLRVLPRLTMAVTDEPVRKRKRLVMLVPGLVAFALYRLAKQVDPLSDPLTLLGVSGLISAVTALWAYRVGRAAPLVAVWKEDGARLLGWLVGWIGFAYGVQLSLLVLALLRVLVQYDFLRHPDGPAMMAIIIACTSVARDAFEIGHVRLLQRKGEPVMTFPDGAPLRRLLRKQPGPLTQWTVLAACLTAALSMGVAQTSEAGRSELGQFTVVSLIAGSLALVAYLAGEQRLHPSTPGAIASILPEPAKTGSFPMERARSRTGGWRALLSSVGWAELFRFWWWPGLAFAATYYLVLAGMAAFLFRLDQTDRLMQGMIAGMVGGIMALYCYYLGYRRHVEDQVQQMVPASLLRCPFVMGILSKASSPQSSAIGQQLQKLSTDSVQGRRG